MDISYKEIYAMNKEEARKQVVDIYFAAGSISQVARLWHTSRNVIRKWVKKFEQRGKESPKGESRKPHSSLKPLAIRETGR